MHHSSLATTHHRTTRRSEPHKRSAAQLDISYDSFVRTTDARHEALVTAVLERVWERGDIYKSDYEGFYCIDCEEYKVWGLCVRASDAANLTANASLLHPSML